MKAYFRISIIMIITIFTISLWSQNRSIKFEKGNWNDVKAKAKKENKLIFMDAFASWCGPCKWMDANIFTNDTVADYYNKTFINAKYDMEKDQGIDIRKEYSVNVFPTFLFINGDGEMIHREAGSRPVNEFIRLGMDAQDPTKQFATIKKNFESGKKDAKTIETYLEEFYYSDPNPEKVLSDYFASQKENDLFSENNWNLMEKYLNKTDSKEFTFLLKNSDKFSKLYGADKVENKIVSNYLSAFNKILRNKNMTGFDSLKKVIEKSKYKGTKEILLQAQMRKYEVAKDWKNYSKLAVELIEKFQFKKPKFNSSLINDISYKLFENCDDKKVLTKATDWMKKVVENDKTKHMYIDTYASLLYKNGKKKEAIEWEQKAIQLAKDQNETEMIPDYEKNIQQWQK